MSFWKFSVVPTFWNMLCSKNLILRNVGNQEKPFQIKKKPLLTDTITRKFAKKLPICYLSAILVLITGKVTSKLQC